MPYNNNGRTYTNENILNRKRKLPLEIFAPKVAHRNEYQSRKPHRDPKIDMIFRPWRKHDEPQKSSSKCGKNNFFHNTGAIKLAMDNNKLNISTSCAELASKSLISSGFSTSAVNISFIFFISIGAERKR